MKTRALLLLVVLGTAAMAHAKKDTGFLDRSLKIGGVTYRYQVYVPDGWNKSAKWPVVLFLHGAGERGDDGVVQTQVGIGTAIRWHRDRFPCIVVMPQCRRNIWWPDPKMEEMALKALDAAVKEFRGDPQRLYLTGLSMGGYGTWSVAAKNPGKFAALVPICGGVTPPRAAPATMEFGGGGDPQSFVARKVGKTPVWIFHGADDRTVPVAESRKMNEALKAAGADVRYTEYPGVAHNSWDKAYAEPDLMKWLLSQRRAN